MSFFKKDSRKKKAFEERKTFLLTEETPFDIREGFRNFKASLSVSMPKKANDEGVAILITSSCPREGKTTLAVNLAVTYAISNAKVVIIDADIRKGRVARYFSEKSKKGLSDCLSVQATLEEVTHVSKTNEKLSYITCGTHSPRPYELLESEEMKKLLSRLKTEYDYVIIDTPPLLVVSDALAIVNDVDGVVVACRYQISLVSDIAKTLNTLTFANANVLGTVVNDYKYPERNKGSYGGRYYYYKSYE